MFNSPPALLLLPIIGGLIVAMYILKLRRKDVVVSSTFLWRQVIRDVQANAPFQKLRQNLLMFLQLIVAALLILSLARPFLRLSGAPGRSVVLIVDTSASMRATDVSPSRIEVAKRKAHDIVNGLGKDDMMMVLSASSRPEALSGFTHERSELHRLIDGIQPHDTPTNMRDALNLAADLVSSHNNGEAGRIELISDGGFESGQGNQEAAPQYTLANLNLGKTHVTFHPVGKGHDNVGITAVDFRRSIGGEKSVQLLVVTHNYSAQPKKLTEEIYVEENLFDAHEVNLAPGTENTEVFDVQEPAKPVAMRVKLDVQDDLATDNEATLVLRPRKLLKVLLLGTENLWLENALKVDPGVTLSKATAFTPTQAKAYDVIIFNESAPAKLPEGNYLFIHCTSDQSPAKLVGRDGSSAGGTEKNGPEKAVEKVVEKDGVGFADIEREHPVLRYVDFGRENLLGVYSAAPLGWGREIAVGDSGSLIVTGEKNKMRAEYVSFSLEKSVHFLLTVAFPIFMSNSVRWLGTGGDDSEQAQIRTGETLTLPALPGTPRLTITRPDGSRREVAVGDKGGAIFTETDLAGLYKVEAPNLPPYQFAANLASASESDITPHNALTILENADPTPTRQVKTPHDLYPYLAFLALLVLLGEWYAFHRRIHLN